MMRMGWTYEQVRATPIHIMNQLRVIMYVQAQQSESGSSRRGGMGQH